MWGRISTLLTLASADFFCFSSFSALPRPWFPTDTEIRELLVECDHVKMQKNGKTEKKKQNHLKPIITFALNTRCRREEILSLILFQKLENALQT